MDEVIHKEKVEVFLEQFHPHGTITTVLCHGFETCGPFVTELRKLVVQHIEYLQDVVVVPVYSIESFCSEVKTNDNVTRIIEALIMYSRKHSILRFEAIRI